MLHHYRKGPLILTILFLSTIVGKGALWLQTHGWDHHGWLGGVSVASLVGGFLYVHDRYLWRLPGFNLLVDVPVVRGKYEGTVVYEYNGEQHTKRVVAEIRQRASHLGVCCRFSAEEERPQEETLSRSVHADLLDRDGHGRWQLCMLYQNEGERITGSTGAHDGFAALDLDPATGILKGHYFNGRKSMGIMELVPSTNK